MRTGMMTASAALAILPCVLFAGEVRVAPDGLSPHAAIAQIRAAKAQGDRSAWTVKVAPGRYVLSEPLVMRPEDSGSPSAPVRWVAEGGGAAVFAGGGRLTGWRDDGDGTWSAPVPKGADGKPAWFQSLYVNGRRAVRSRHPNAGFFHVDSAVQTPVTNAGGKVSYTQRAVVKDSAADVLSGLSPEELADVELQARVKWSYGAFSVTGWSPADRTLTVDTADKKLPGWGGWAGTNNLFCLENVRAGFDQAGEWLYDRPAKRIRYRPLTGETRTALEAYAPTSCLPSVLRLEGDPAKGRFVTDVSFEGISFELSTVEGDRLPSGFVQTYQYQGATRAGGCVYAKGAHRVTFDRCRIAHTENYAVRMDVGCVSNRIVRCEMTDLGAGGVFIGDVRANYFINHKVDAHYPFEGRKIPYGDPRVAAYHPCAFITVDDCTISQAGRVNPEGCGVLITQASDCAVTHCDIGDLYYTGVSLGWTWGYSESLSQRNTVAFNRIHDIGQGVMSDMGGVYTLGTSFGTCVSNNVICNVKSLTYGGWGLYNDEGSEGIVFENNLVYDVKDAAFHQHYGRENVLRNNVFANAEKTQLALSIAEGHRSVSFDRNIVYWTGDAPFYKAPGWSIRLVDGKQVGQFVPKEKRGTAENVGWGTNLVWRTDGKALRDGDVPPDCVSSAVVADPLFVDAAKGDFRLKEGSPATKIGFVPWDYARSGRRPLAVTRETVLTKGFTIDLKVDCRAASGDETLYEAGPVRLVLRRAGADPALAKYDRDSGNYLNFPMADGTCPVLEATICAKAGRVGIPLGVIEKPEGVHDVTLDYSPVKWAMAVDGRYVDDEFPVPACPVAWPDEAQERILSPRVRAATFAAPSRKGAIPEDVAAPRPVSRPIQYWTPDGHNQWVGDVAPAFLDGKLHVFYLVDRRHHGSGAGTGRHQFAHLVTDDLVHWTELPMALPIREVWQTVGTGTPFLKDGKLALSFGWHTARFPEVAAGKPLGGFYAVSEDGIHFTGTGVKVANAQNPSIYNRPDGGYELVGEGGGIFRSRDLVSWKSYDAKLPFRGDCPSLFDWHGHRYLLQGFTNMAYSPDGTPGSFVNWTDEPDKLYEGLSVPMVTAWKGDRRLYIGWLNHLAGWGGWLVFREVVAYPDGRLGLKWVPEIASPAAPRTYRAARGARFVRRFRSLGNAPALVLDVNPETRTASFADDVPDAAFGEAHRAQNVRIGGVRGLDADYSVRVIVHYDPKADATIFDAEIAGQRTLICRRQGRFAE